MSSEPPDAAQAAALAAFGGRPGAAVVVELVSDDPLVDADTSLSRRLVFAAPGWVITFEARWMGDAYAAAVAVAPARPFGVTVFVADPTPHALVESTTPAGSAAVEVGAVPAGPCMLRLSARDGAVETEWVTLLRPEQAS
jgi:hypothetical protein